jgi:hypothetical protein
VALLGLRASCGVFFGRFLWLGLRLFWVFFFFFCSLLFGVSCCILPVYVEAPYAFYETFVYFKKKKKLYLILTSINFALFKPPRTTPYIFSSKLNHVDSVKTFYASTRTSA